MNKGKIADYTKVWEHVEAKLYGFGINYAQLADAHKKWINN